MPVADSVTSTSSTSSRPTSASSAPSTPVRPRQVATAGLKSCDLVTTDQQRRFGIDRPPNPSDDPFLQAVTCNYGSRAQKVGFGVSMLTAFGIDRFQPGKVRGDLRPMTVRDFPAMEFHTVFSDTLDDACIVVVDIADGQAVHVDYGEEGVRPHLGKPILCTRAAQIADVIMGNLLAR